MKKGVAIFGAGGHARVVSSILKLLNVYIFGVFDDSYSGPEKIQGITILGKFEDILRYKGSVISVYLALGDNSIRREKFEFLEKHNIHTPALVHSKAILEDRISIGNGTVICTGAIVGTEVKIGKCVIINTGCSVDHETQVGDFVHLAPQAVIAGRTIIGSNTFIGMNACVADKLVIGNNVTIGAGSVVLKDVPGNTKIVGVYS